VNSEVTEGRGARREVLNQGRRKVERALAAEGAAEELAAAAAAVLRAAEGRPDSAELAGLSAALAGYHQIRGIEASSADRLPTE
jgi:hypothetical protein